MELADIDKDGYNISIQIDRIHIPSTPSSSPRIAHPFNPPHFFPSPSLIHTLIPDHRNAHLISTFPQFSKLTQSSFDIE